MKFFNEEKTDFNHIIRYLKQNGAELDTYHKIKIREILNNSYFMVYEICKVKKVGFWWRFTFPFYIVAVCLLFLFCCFKYLFTGSFLITSKRTMEFFEKWWAKICSANISTRYK